MRDLIRTYKNIIQGKDDSDTETESQPLMSSSSSSTTSFGTMIDMFHHDSETTDCEPERIRCPAVITNVTPTKSSPTHKSPFSLSNQFDLPSMDFYSNSGAYENYQYFHKHPDILAEESMIQAKLIALALKEYPKDEARGTNSSLVTIFAIWNTLMGTSLLAMSWGIEKAGLVPGLFLIILMAGVCLYTAYTIIEISAGQGEGLEVPELCRIYYGTWLEYIAKFFSLVVLMGACIVYWVLMSNFLYNSVQFLYDFLMFRQTEVYNTTVICQKEHLLNLTGTNNTILKMKVADGFFDMIWDLHRTVPVILAFLMFPILNFRSPTFFTKFNSVGALSVMFIIVFVAIKASYWGINIQDWNYEFDLKANFCALSGMLSLSYFIHNIIISVIKNNRNQEHNARDLSIAFFLVTFTYVFVGVLFYLSFPLAKACIEDNFLNNFSKQDILTIIARVLLFFQLLTVFPLMAFMLRRDILVNVSHLFEKPRWENYKFWKIVTINTIVVVICILFACFLPRIGTLIRYTGAFSGSVYIFTLPCMLKIAVLKKQSALTYYNFTLYILIIILGVLNLISQFFIEEN